MTATTEKMDLDQDIDVDEQDVEAGEPTDGEDAESGPEPASVVHGRRRRWLLGLSVLACVGMLAVSGVLGWNLWQQHELTRAGQQAQQAAVAYAEILTSIDSAKVDENFNQVLDGATGEFKDMYSQSSMQLRQLLIDNKATSHGVVVESAVQAVSRDTVVVLMFVDQSVSNTAVPDPRIDRSRIKMTMKFVDGRWRASKVELP